jgi:hypothetical protein
MLNHGRSRQGTTSTTLKPGMNFFQAVHGHRCRQLQFLRILHCSRLGCAGGSIERLAAHLAARAPAIASFLHRHI